jgi:RHS repeat-associated protein
MVLPPTSRAAQRVHRLRLRRFSGAEPSNSVKICTLTPVSEAFDYDSNNRLLHRQHKQGASTVSGHNYALNNLGRRTDETFPSSGTPARTYGYDPLGQVTSAAYGAGANDSYAYDKAGNRSTATVFALGGTAKTYHANNANQYTTITGVPAPISYDFNGNLTQQNHNTYTWDSHNRLLSVVPNNPATGAKALHYTYDGLHRRIVRQIREWNGGSWTNLDTIRFLYDAWNVVEEHNIIGSGQPLARTRTWGTDLSGSFQGAGGVGGLLLTEEVSGGTTTAYHYHYDGNGNVTEITDNTGSSAATYRYDAFGNTLLATGNYAAQNRYRFSTKPLDAEVPAAPLYYYGYRYYDPVTGRWPSRDPIEEEGGLNLHGFVDGDSVNYIDISGMKKYRPGSTTANNINRQRTKTIKKNHKNMVEDVNERQDKLGKDVKKIIDLTNDVHGAFAEDAGKKMCDAKAAASSYKKGCACCYVHIKSWKILIGGGKPQNRSQVESVTFEEEECRGKKRGPWAGAEGKTGQYEVNNNLSYEISY